MRRLTTVLVLATTVAGFWVGSALAGGMSAAEEEKFGRKMMVALRSSMAMVGDRALDDYVSRVGRALERVADKSHFKPRFYLMDDPSLNAFAGPGGVIVVTTGLALVMMNVDELAGVLGHELAHSNHRHLSSRIYQAEKTSLASLAGMLAGVVAGVLTGNPALAQAGIFGSLAASQTAQLSFSREQELDADRVGSLYMIKAGYDVNGITSLLEKMRHAQNIQSEEPPQYLSTHPGLIGRLSFMKNLRPPQTINPDRIGLEDFKWFKGRIDAHYDRWDYFKDKTGLLADYGRGLKMLKEHRFEEALPLLHKVNRGAPKATIPLIDYIFCLRRLGRSDESLAILKNALTTNQDRFTVTYYMGQTYLDLNQPQKAIDILEELDELYPNDPRLLRDLSVAYGRVGKLAKAHSLLAWSFTQRGQTTKALLNFDLAMKQAKTGQEKEQIVELRTQALELLPKPIRTQ